MTTLVLAQSDTTQTTEMNTTEKTVTEEQIQANVKLNSASDLGSVPKQCSDWDRASDLNQACNWSTAFYHILRLVPQLHMLTSGKLHRKGARLVSIYQTPL